MNNFFTIELKNNNKYIVVEILNLNGKIYFLLAKILPEGNKITNLFDIFIFNVLENSFEEITEEDEYLCVKKMFEKRLKENENNNNLEYNKFSNISKYKIIDIDNLVYVLKNDKGEIFNLEMEFFDNIDIKINDYMYISDSLINENNIIRFGSVYNDKTEIIKVVRDERVFYLQRYYG